MKRWIITMLLLAVLAGLTACGGPETTTAPQDTKITSAAGGPVDVDLTQLSSTMVYSEVYNIVVNPEDYVGKVIRMEGQAFSTYYEPTDQTYYTIIIADATACCAQGLEYVLADGYDYPEDDSQSTVTGTLRPYEENGVTWYHLTDAVVES